MDLKVVGVFDLAVVKVGPISQRQVYIKTGLWTLRHNKSLQKFFSTQCE